MGNRGGIYIVIAVFTVGLLLLLQYNKPKEINWFPSYVSTHKIPYGTYVLGDIMQNLFGEKTQQINEPPFAFLDTNKNIEGTYIFINDYIEFGETELNRLLDWTSKGNTLFLASRDFEDQLLDTLHLNTASLYSDYENVRSHRHRLVNPKLETKNGYLFKKEDYVTYFMEYGTQEMTVIGTVTNINKSNTSKEQFYNVVKCKFGNGEVILSTFPKAFTNFFILQDDNKNYTAGLLSYLDGSRNIYMDNNYKSGKSVYISPMHIFLNTKELKWAYYLVLIGALIYIIFEGKRKQRAIPVVLPIINQTLAFTRTIADMYYEKGEAKPIAEHKIANFLEYIRSRFHLGTIQREEEFYINLSSRSGHSVEEIQRLFAFLEQVRNQETVTDNQLKELNTSIEKFKKRVKTA
ncbi:MAG TPA: DUF4350 domain-containing protein [Pricia sp.]|nr:DUF4350 domain-containing protein [Pricia sp.]